MVFNPLAPSGFQDLLFVQRGHHAEIVGVEILIGGKGRLLDAGFQSVRGSLGHFQFHQT